MKKIIPTIMAGLLLLPAAASAYRFGVGGYTNLVSRGLEFTVWADLGEKCQWFIAPHGFGVYYFDNDDADSLGEGYYSVGLRTGIMWSTEKWISPLVGIGGGYTYNVWSYESTDYGARLFAGLSVAPFNVLSQEVSWLAWTDAIRGVRFTFESGVQYHYSYSTWEDWVWNENEQQEELITRTEELTNIAFPDFGFGISYNW